MNKINTVDIFPKESCVYNPAFDVTPSKLVTKLITNKKVINSTMKDILSLKNESE